jgi:rare lipoprotein A
MQTTFRTRLLPAVLAVGLATPAASLADSPSGGVAAPSGGEVTITSGRSAYAGRPARVRGYVPAADAGRTVRVERYDGSFGSWLAVGSGVAAADGRFVATWQSAGPGRFTLRVVIDHGGEASAATASSELAVTVYQPARATWYGPGFYGRRTACGQRLTRALVGVAHRTLPCGTQVMLYHGGRAILVPVVDRGPFANGAEWDLTAAAARAVGLTQTGTVGTLPVPRSAP